jgi:hypothetical protein
LRVSRSCHPRFDAVALASGYAVTGPRDPLPPRTRGGPRASAAGRFGGMPASAKMGPSRSCMKRSYASADSQTSVIRAPSSVIDSMWAIWPSGTLPGPAPSRYTRPSSCWCPDLIFCRIRPYMNQERQPRTAWIRFSCAGSPPPTRLIGAASRRRRPGRWPGAVAGRQRCRALPGRRPCGRGGYRRAAGQHPAVTGASSSRRWPGLQVRAGRPPRAGHLVTEQGSPSRGAHAARLRCRSAPPLEQ